MDYSNTLINLPPSMVEFACNTTRTVADLLYSGRLEDFPDIKFILAHAGGTIPYIAGRLAIFEMLKPSLKEKVPLGTLTYLKRLYYNTTLSTSPSALKCLLDFVPSTQVLFGSDYPFVPTDGVAIEMSEFDSYLAQELILQISHKTAENLFPRLQEKK